jgi:quaternary ammonium compound-resistance protein SugE
MMNGWLILLLAGFFEVGFTTFMKLSDGFTRWGYVALFAISAILSFSCLAQAMKTIPLGTAYAVWTGIGAAGTALIGILIFKDPSSTGRVIFLMALVASIVGLKFFSPSEP